MQRHVFGLSGATSGLLRPAAGAIMLLVAGAAIAQAPQRSADSAERAGDSMDRVICKRFTETGSLVKGYKSCKTKREWERERDNIRSLRGTSGSCSSAESGSCGGV
jgi:hypothetical protein